MPRCDVLVIGSGLCGLMAARTVAQTGARVALVATGAGRYAQSPGWIHKPTTDAAQALQAFQSWSAEAGCAFATGTENRLLLPDILGNTEELCMAPLRMALADVRSAADTMIVGIEGLTSFDAAFVAERLNGRDTQYRAARIVLPCALGTPVTTARIASCFDRDARFRADLARALRKAGSGCTRVLMPGVLGILSDHVLLNEFASAVGVELGELATHSPSAPALRVQQRLEHSLARSGVEMNCGYPATEFLHDGTRVIGARLATPGNGRCIYAQTTLFAAGSTSRLKASPCAGLVVAAAYDNTADQIAAGMDAAQCALQGED